jgi:hypothetical protein
MSLVLDLSPETEKQIRELAAASGQDVQAFVLQVLAETLANAEARQLRPSGSATGEEGKPQLPEWCRVYEGLTDEQIDELDRSIVRSPSSREVG